METATNGSHAASKNDLGTQLGGGNSALNLLAECVPSFSPQHIETQPSRLARADRGLEAGGLLAGSDDVQSAAYNPKKYYSRDEEVPKATTEEIARAGRQAIQNMDGFWAGDLAHVIQ